MLNKITFGSVMAAISTIASVVACHYAIKAFDASKAPTFPLENAFRDSVEIASLTKDANQFENFIESNVARIVYLNLYLDPDSVDVEEGDVPEVSPEDEDTDLEAQKEAEEHAKLFEPSTVTIWTECYEGFNRKLRPSHENHCTGIEISFLKNPQGDSQLSWLHGAYYLKGYFSIVHYSGPYQGHRIATLRGESAR